MQLFKDKKGTSYPISRIERITPRWKYQGKDEWNSAKVYLRDGDEYGIEITEPELASLERKMGRVIPAQPGFNVLVFHADPDGDHFVSHSVVIAWREDEFGEFDPVVADDAFSHTEDFAVEDPSGKVSIPFQAEYQDRAAWEADMRAQANRKKSVDADSSDAT